MSQVHDEEPTLLMSKCEEHAKGVMLLNEASTMAKIGLVENKMEQR